MSFFANNAAALAVGVVVSVMGWLFGGTRGDLLVEVLVAESNKFARQDLDIFSTVDISFAQAALGSDVRIATVDGDVIYSVKAGTQPGTRVRLRGKGVPSLRSKNVRGDHYVTLNVVVPTRLSEDAKQALRDYDAVSGNSLGLAGTENDAAGSKNAGKGPGHRRRVSFGQAFLNRCRYRKGIVLLPE